MDYFIVREVQKLMQKSWIGFEAACRGTPPSFASNIPDFLTPEKTLAIRAKLLKQEAEKIQKVFETIDKEGRSFWEDQERASRIINSARVDLLINVEG